VAGAEHHVEIVNEPIDRAVDGALLERVVLESHVSKNANVVVAVVDDAQIHQLNVRHLQHDYPTDVLSYALEETAQYLEGEIVVSAQTATRNAPQYGWSARDELTLYAVHGALHLAGFRDDTQENKAEMRHAEQRVMARLGLQPPSLRYVEVVATGTPSLGADRSAP